MSTDTQEKTSLKLCDFPPDSKKEDIESFLSQYKSQIISITFESQQSFKDVKKIVKVVFKDMKSANDCRINMNLKKLNTCSIRIMWYDKDFKYNNKDKNNLYIKSIPKNKTARELFEYFNQFGDIYSIKINEDEKGNIMGTGFVTFYKNEDAKKAVESTNNKKIWDSDMELIYQFNNYGYDKGYHIDNLKIYINNIPEKYDKKEVEDLCKDFGKIKLCNVNTGKKGRFAVVTFSNQTEAKTAVDKLNNKEIEGKKILAKEFQTKQKYYPNHMYHNPFPRFPPQKNTNLHIKNIPLNATEEDIKKVFGQYGEIKNMKLEKETVKKEEKGETKTITLNKGFGYVNYENPQSAKLALESLNGKYLPGFTSWSKPLLISFFVNKETKKIIDGMQPEINMYNRNPMIFPPMNPMNLNIYPPYNPMIPYPGPFNMYPNLRFQRNNAFMGYRPRFNKRGKRRGYYKNNNQRQNDNKNEINNDIKESKDNKDNKEEKKIEEKNIFDREAYNKLIKDEEKKDFLGELIYNAVQQSPHFKGKEDDDAIGKITGMIIGLPNEEEIIKIYENPSMLDSTIKQGLSLINENK